MSGSNDGLSFALLSQDGREGAIDGTLAGIGCRTSAGYQTLTQRRGLYVKACGLAGLGATAGLQVLAVADAQGGSLLQSYAGNWQTTTPNNRPFATDGMFSYLGANNLGGGGTLSEWTHNAEGLASGALSLPTFDLSVSPAQPRFQSLKDGVLHAMVDWAGTTPYILNYDASNPAATLGGYFGFFNLPFTSSAYTVPPVTDGEYLYLAINPGDSVNKSGIAFVHLPDNTVLGQPYTQPAAFTLGALANLYTGLALYRGYLYAAWYNGAGSTLSVFDVTTPSAPVAKPAITGMSPGSPALANYLYDLTISGGSLFASGAFLAPPAPAIFLFWSQLGATRDGTSPRYSNIGFFGGPTNGGSIGSPTLIGDTMYLRWNSGLAAFDLRPWWRTQALFGSVSGTTYPLVPAYVSTQGDSSTAYRSNLAPLVIDGPWAYLLSQDFRVFDLR